MEIDWKDTNSEWHQFQDGYIDGVLRYTIRRFNWNDQHAKYYPDKCPMGYVVPILLGVFPNIDDARKACVADAKIRFPMKETSTIPYSPPFQYDDGGRAEAGFPKKAVGDCVCRAIAIATGRPYGEIHARLALENSRQRTGAKEKLNKKRHKQETADYGIYTNRKWFKDYMREIGFEWVSVMEIGKGCQVHLRPDELPRTGHLVVKVSRHYTTVINGVIRDTYDPSRGGTRCVYGYWWLKAMK